MNTSPAIVPPVPVSPDAPFSTNGSTVVDGQPITARTQVDVTPSDPSLELHGFLITHLESNQYRGVKAKFARPVTDDSTRERAAVTPGAAFPSQLQSTAVGRGVSGSTQTVNLNVSQFISDASSATGEVGTVRRFGNVRGSALFAPASNTDGVAPTIAASAGSSTGTSAQFALTATDRLGDNVSAGSVVRALVLYRGVGSDGPWLNAELTRVGSTNTWKGTGPGTGSEIEWFAQAVDGAGNVSVTSQKATFGAAQFVVGLQAGTNSPSGGFADGYGATAQFFDPRAAALDGVGNLFVADSSNNLIRRISPAGDVTTYAGSEQGFQDSTDPFTASFFDPRGIAVDGLGDVFVADHGYNLIRKIAPDGAVTTIGGSRFEAGYADGPGAVARFEGPWGMAVDSVGNVFVADSTNGTIRKLTPAGVVSTVAGAPASLVGVGSADGTGAAARFNNPRGLAIDSADNLYIADYGNNLIRRMTPAGVVTTVYGTGAEVLAGPEGLDLDASGNLIVAASCQVVQIAPNRTAAVLAGSSTDCRYADGAGAQARFAAPTDVVLDGSGGGFVVDRGSNTIRRLTQR